MDPDMWEVFFRLGGATLAGMIIGANRDLQGKPIGVRTLGLVSLGSAVVTLSTVHYSDLAQNPDALSRVVQGAIQGVMAGISFIGAGVILRDAKARTVVGLTTAASVWVTAALGIACALADWRVAGIGIGMSLFLLVVVHQLEKLVKWPSAEKHSEDAET
jgi:putative Mg2+ transporter-C (MgtC) family protein